MNGSEYSNASGIEEYLAAVRGALGDLPSGQREELMDDLAEHLTEVAAEAGPDDGALIGRLGEPIAYAAELRAAAGLGSPRRARPRLQDRAAATVGRGSRFAARFDVQAGRAFGYARARDLLQALRPGWWVLRGWIAAQFVSGVHDRASWSGLVPRPGGNRLSGAAITVVMIAVSVWLGRRTADGPRWSRRLMLGASGLAVVGVIAGACVGIGTTNYVYVDPAAGSYPAGGYGYSGGDLSDVYVYDQAGNPIPQARLFDQYGNPVQLGDPVCRDGQDAPGAAADRAADDGSGYGSGYGDGQADDPVARAWTYPLCPDDPGPFRAGPGAVTQPGPAPAPAFAAGTPASSTPGAAPAPAFATGTP